MRAPMTRAASTTVVCLKTAGYAVDVFKDMTLTLITATSPGFGVVTR